LNGRRHIFANGITVGYQLKSSDRNTIFVELPPQTSDFTILNHMSAIFNNPTPYIHDTVPVGPEHCEASTEFFPESLPEARARKRLEDYLECEGLLKEFFSELDFCYNECISQEYSLYDDSLRGDVGCCPANSHSCVRSEEVDSRMMELLRSERVKRYGLPINTETPLKKGGQPCRYHTLKGCTLESHMSPVCVTFVCSELEAHLIKRDVHYSFPTLRKHTEGILNGFLCEREIDILKSQLRGFKAKIKSKKS
jgi:hypothetical protein